MLKIVCGKLDGLSDRNEREDFCGGLVNQADTKRRERAEDRIRDSVDEFVGTVRSAEIAPRRPPPHTFYSSSDEDHLN